MIFPHDHNRIIRIKRYHCIKNYSCNQRHNFISLTLAVQNNCPSWTQGPIYLALVQWAQSKGLLQKFKTIIPCDHPGHRPPTHPELGHWRVCCWNFNRKLNHINHRLSDVATYTGPYSPLYEMRLMEENQNWNLIRQKVFA